MFGTGVFNAFYWSLAFLDYTYHQGTQCAGFSLLGDTPQMGVIGALGTGVILGATYNYAHHYVWRAYESADGRRVGFQFYTMLGKPGRKVEVVKGNAHLLNVDSLRNTNKLVGAMMGSSVPVKVKNLTFNVLLDAKGAFDEDDKLFDMLKRAE
jgi:hypothetical protein